MKFMKLLFLFIFFSNILCQSTLTKLKEIILKQIKAKLKTLTDDSSQLIRRIDYEVPIMSGSIDEGEIESKCKELSFSTTQCPFKQSKYIKNEICGDKFNLSLDSLLAKHEYSLYWIKYENEKFHYYLIKGLLLANLNQQKQKVTKKQCTKFLMFKKCKNYEEFVDRKFNQSELNIISNVLKKKFFQEIIKKLE